MLNETRFLLKEITWEEARQAVLKVNPNFASVIDELSPSSDLTLFEGSYPYGMEIVKQGVFQLLTQSGKLIPLNSPEVPRSLQDKLNYNDNTNPVSLVLENSIEVYTQLDDRIISLYGAIGPGKIMSTWRILNPVLSQAPVFLWDMSSGARTMFMLPKISEMEAHDRLTASLKIKAGVPDGLINHWNVFKEIANSQAFKDCWHVKVLHFTKPWFNHLSDDAWLGFRNFLIETGWKGSEFGRNKQVWELVFSMIEKSRNSKPNAHVVNIAKHLFSMGVGAAPGFRPAITNEIGPINQLQDAYMDLGYRLENYFPTIMYPCIFNMYAKNESPIYASLNFPTEIEFSPSPRKRASIITNLCNIKSFMEYAIKKISNNEYNIGRTPLFDLVGMGKFDFYHPNSTDYLGILDPTEISNEDSSFTMSKNKYGNTSIPDKNTFFRGCIRLKK